MSMKRLKFGSNTDALIKAVEMADECDSIVVLYQKKPEAGGETGFYNVGQITNAELLWHVERFRLYLLGALDRDLEDE
jgi:hypothetical protein